VNRDSDAFRQQHLKPLAKDSKLKLAFPTAPTDARGRRIEPQMRVMPKAEREDRPLQSLN
jgi:hypothetical protein